MRYSASKNFEKQFKRLNAQTKDKVIKRLEVFIEDPFHISLRNHELHGEWSSYRSINITGDVRAIYKDTDSTIAHFVAIGSHSELYQ